MVAIGAAAAAALLIAVYASFWSIEVVARLRNCGRL
jgi:hypothetical protein